jgi:pilus assembly protein CpaE
MHTVVLSDNVLHPTSLKLRELLRAGGDRQGPVLIAFAQADEALPRTTADLLVVVLSPDPQTGLTVLRKARARAVAPIVAVGQVGEPRLILRALHGGADHFIDEAELEPQLEALLARLQRKEEPPQAPAGKLVSLLGASGGSGTSTLAVNLAAVLAREHQRCALVDLKPAVGDLAALLDLKPTHTLADLCLNAGRMDRAMFETALTTHPSGVHLLAPPQMYDDIRLITAQGVKKSLALARESYPWTVADLEDCFHEEQVVALRQADAVLLVFRLDFTSLRNTRRALDHLDQIDVPADRVRLVTNRYGQAKELPAEEAEQALGRKIAHFIPDDPKTVNGANNTGVPAVLKAPATKVAQSIVQLARGLKGAAPGKSANGRTGLARGVGWLTSFT